MQTDGGKLYITQSANNLRIRIVKFMHLDSLYVHTEYTSNTKVYF